ncbi:hypothetical protein NST62_08030 [Ureibacillus sp. FSL K6-8385]|uniref:hypothetical protein n=1 Tax=Ureibacillus TaxID=160795 RepID=UPI002E243589|nr:hypothetical protein [Ureibacillus terrenus]
MAKIDWEMMTQFIFSKEYGIVEEVVSVQVIPRWQQSETEDSIRLTGIYHIKATVRFNPAIKPTFSEGTLIEHLDLKGDEGYFEYAMPLEVDLPREKVAKDCKPELIIDDISFFVYDGSSCTFKWEVNCTFDEPVAGALFQVESEEEAAESAAEKTAERVAVVATNTGEVLETSKTDQPPATLEHRLVNEEREKGQTSETLHLLEDESLTNFERFKKPLNETDHKEASKKEEAVQTYNFVEEAKKIRKEEEQQVKQQVNESSNKLHIDDRFKSPSDTDDFYNELSESFSILKFR